MEIDPSREKKGYRSEHSNVGRPLQQAHQNQQAQQGPHLRPRRPSDGYRPESRDDHRDKAHERVHRPPGSPQERECAEDDAKLEEQHSRQTGGLERSRHQELAQPLMIDPRDVLGE